MVPTSKVDVYKDCSQWFNSCLFLLSVNHQNDKIHFQMLYCLLNRCFEHGVQQSFFLSLLELFFLDFS